MYAEVFGIDVPLTESQPTESTQGTHRTPRAPRSTRLTPLAPMPTVDKADELILQDTLQISLAEQRSREEQEARENVALVNEHLASVEIEKMVKGQTNVIDDCSIPRNDDHNILDTRLDPRSDKESPKVEITNDKEVEITKVVILVNVNEEEEETTYEVYELKRRQKRKVVEECKSTPFPTPIRSPRIHTNLVSLDTEKLQELTVRDQAPVYVAEGLILERQNNKEEMERMIAKAILQERGITQVNEEEQGPSTSGNKEQVYDYDFWTESYASDDDEIPTKQVSQDIMEEVSLTIDEAKLKKIVDEIMEILVSPYPRKTTPLVQSCQRDPEAPALSLINQDLLYLKKGSPGPEKIVLSLHKFPAVIFNDDDIEERTSRWVNKCVKKFNPYARYGVEHWKNPHAKIFYIRKQKEPGKPKENINKNDIEDMYLLIVNGKVPDYAKTGLLWSLSVFIRSSVIWERVHDFQLGVESYQQKVNLTAPTISFPGIEKHEVFYIIYEPVHGIIYKYSKKKKRMMRHSEIHKFCDAIMMLNKQDLTAAHWFYKEANSKLHTKGSVIGYEIPSSSYLLNDMEDRGPTEDHVFKKYSSVKAGHPVLRVEGSNLLAAVIVRDLLVAASFVLAASESVLLLRTMLQWEEQLRSEAGKLADVNDFREIAVVSWPDEDILRLRSGSTAADAATRVGQMIHVPASFVLAASESVADIRSSSQRERWEAYARLYKKVRARSHGLMLGNGLGLQGSSEQLEKGSSRHVFTTTTSGTSSQTGTSQQDPMQALTQLASQLGFNLQPLTQQAQAFNTSYSQNSRGRGRGQNNRTNRGQFNWASNQNAFYGTCNRCGAAHIPSDYPNPSDSSSIGTSEPYYGEDFSMLAMRAAMAQEYVVLMCNATWSLVSPIPNANVVDYKWVYKLKRDQTGAITRYKARLIAKRFNQQQGIDYFETFSLVVKSTTIPTVLSLAITTRWTLRQLDVQNAFLHEELHETVYLRQPPGFVDLTKPDHLCLLYKSIYRLKQAPCAWFHRLIKALQTLGFRGSTIDPSVLISSLSRLRPDAVIKSLKPSLDGSRRRRFMPATPSPRDRVNFSKAKPVPSLITTIVDLHLDDSPLFDDPVKYRQLVGYVLHAYTDSHDSSLSAFSDVEWVGYLDDCQSTWGYAIYLGNNLISRLEMKLFGLAAYRLNELNEADNIVEDGEQKMDYTEDDLLQALDLIEALEYFMDHQWKMYKSHLRTPATKKMSLNGKRVRGGQVHVHTTGAHSFAWKRDKHLSFSEDPNDVVFFGLAHTTLEGSFVIKGLGKFMAQAKRELSRKTKAIGGSQSVDHEVEAEIARMSFKNLNLVE
uniref:Putative polyprotein n=1 Tax=Tanacetum cinerariifolium TaxID=118510 RepID=A0A6L2JDB3_TANCI|nr:putative polyprotein [Tanacetum cinerariifolium]